MVFFPLRQCHAFRQACGPSLTQAADSGLLVTSPSRSWASLPRAWPIVTLQVCAAHSCSVSLSMWGNIIGYQFSLALQTGKFILRACSSELLLKLPGAAALHPVSFQPVTRLTLLINTHTVSSDDSNWWVQPPRDPDLFKGPWTLREGEERERRKETNRLGFKVCRGNYWVELHASHPYCQLGLDFWCCSLNSYPVKCHIVCVCGRDRQPRCHTQASVHHQAPLLRSPVAHSQRDSTVQ